MSDDFRPLRCGMDKLPCFIGYLRAVRFERISHGLSPYAFACCVTHQAFRAREIGRQCGRESVFNSPLDLLAASSPAILHFHPCRELALRERTDDFIGFGCRFCDLVKKGIEIETSRHILVRDLPADRRCVIRRDHWKKRSQACRQPLRWVDDSVAPSSDADSWHVAESARHLNCHVAPTSKRNGRLDWSRFPSAPIAPMITPTVCSSSASMFVIRLFPNTFNTRTSAAHVFPAAPEKIGTKAATNGPIGTLRAFE